MDLVSAMDELAPMVTVETFPPGTRRQLQLRRLQQRRRKLAVSTLLPTTLAGFIDRPCPAGFPDRDLCQETTSIVTLTITDEDPDVVEQEYQQALIAAINEGRLQSTLEEVNPSTRIRILDAAGPPPTQAPTGGGDDGISGGAIAGIAIGAAAILLAAIGLAYSRRRREPKEDPFLNTQALADTEGVDRDLAAAGGAAGTLGASQPMYGSKKKSSKSATAFQQLEDAEDVEEPPGDSSSAAGSSGWSSSAGVSSLNTGSADDSLDGGAGAALAAGGATLAAIGATSALASDKDGGNVPNVPAVSRADLDAAIEAGDWAAVGATAALLAATSDSQSHSDRSNTSGDISGSKGASTISSVDAARAAELDHLVDAGDWEGVVLAAAKFEAAEEEDESGSSSRSFSGSKDSQGGSTGVDSSGYTPSELSESPSKVQKREEIRAEVESLVQRVVPEEIDNVDEMMLQFKGREEELVETLRTMQERQVAQKARVAGQKSAKREARMSARQGGGPPAASAAAAAAAPTPAAAPATPQAGGGGDAGLTPGAAAGVTAGVAAALGVAAGIAAGQKKREESSVSKDTSSSPSDSRGSTVSTSRDSGGGKRRRTALELAIEAGDWEAVGEAAAMMSDTSVTTASSGEINALADAGTDSDSSGQAGRLQAAGVNAERAAELDEMIDRGDWTGVVAAASKFSRTDASTAGGSSTQDSASKDSPSQGSGSKDSSPKGASEAGASSLLGAQAPTVTDTESLEGIDPQKALKEEQDALEKAEIWMAIAEQSKPEGSTDAGASDAADWAIARSLSALKSAEEKGDLKKQASKKGAGSSDSVGDQSV